MFIYKITNILTNKVYIGQTVGSVETRFKQHCRHSNSYIYRAINKYGKENFKLETIMKCSSIEELNYWEEKLFGI